MTVLVPIFLQHTIVIYEQFLMLNRALYFDHAIHEFRYWSTCLITFDAKIFSVRLPKLKRNFNSKAVINDRFMSTAFSHFNSL